MYEIMHISVLSMVLFILDLAVFARRSRRVSLGDVTTDSWVLPSWERQGTTVYASLVPHIHV